MLGLRMAGETGPGALLLRVPDRLFPAPLPSPPPGGVDIRIGNKNRT